MMGSLDEIKAILGPSDGERDASETWDALRTRITVLNERAWEGRVSWLLVERWLANFDGRSGLEVDAERLHALYILSQFLYFGSAEIRVLLRALYRDLILIPLIQHIRATLGGTRDIAAIGSKLAAELAVTRFLGVGNPSESGVHLLYFFRQENGLSKQNFLDAAQLFQTERSGTSLSRKLRYPDVRRYIFIDDVCGSGETAKDYSEDFLIDVSAGPKPISLGYYSMFATRAGLKVVRTETVFSDQSGAVYELDESYECLSMQSRYLKVIPPHVEAALFKQVAETYGELIVPGFSGGYGDSQMLIGFHHNTPDNTLPIIWADLENESSVPWTPVFKRYPKVY